MDEELLAIHDVKVLLEWALDKAVWRRNLHLTDTKEYEWWRARGELYASELNELDAYEKALTSKGTKEP